MHVAALGPARLSWLLLGPGAVAAAIFAVMWWVNGQSVASQQILHAVLRPQTTPVGIVLPQGSQLATILVSEGEIVRPGQTLARLDTVATEAALISLEHDLITARYHRHCLLNPEAEPFLNSVQDWLSGDDPDPELVERIKSADAACKAARAGQLSEQEALATALEILEQRRALLQAALGQPKTFGSAKPATQPTTQEGVQLLLARNDLDARIAATTAQMDRLAQETAKAVAEAVADVNTRITQLLGDRAHIRAVLDQTILTAEVGGIVTRVRNPGAGHLARQPITIIDISRREEQTFSLEVLGDQSGNAALEIGLPVQVRLGWPGFEQDVYPGTLVARRNPTSGAIQQGFDVALSDDAKRDLQSATGSFLVAGAETRATAQVELGPVAASSLGHKALDSFWQTTFLFRAAGQAAK